ETVEVESDGTFSFPGRIASGGSYDVVVQVQPSNPAQACTVTNGSGTVTTADVTDVSVTCTRREFTIGGVVGGLAGSGLILRNNGTVVLTVTVVGVFKFASANVSARTYAVDVVSLSTMIRTESVR